MMNSKSELITNYKSTAAAFIGWIFGLVALAVGTINTFWGNDPGYGIFILLLSFVYFPPTYAYLKKIIGISIPGIFKFLLAVFIIFSALGVAELPDKIDLMLADFDRS